MIKIPVAPTQTLSPSKECIEGTIAPLNPSHPAIGKSHPALNSFPPDTLPPETVDKIGDYKILGILGSGGMGIVYKALDEKLGRIVALKMLQVGSNPDEFEIQRFRGEAEMLGNLQHPHIVQIFHFDMHNGAPYLVMEYVSGSSLDRELQGKPLYPRKAAEQVELLARAMHAAHEKGIIHRDLKPANILLTPEGMPKIADFGLAKNLQFASGLTQTGAVMGTPSYMSPEQAAGRKDVGPASDVYSLGAILYEMMTGRPPFKGATLQETLEQVQMADPTPPTRIVPKLPPDLQSVCLTCLHKSPGRRYPTALALADELKNFLDGLPVKARPTNSLERIIRIVTRRPLRAALVASSVLIVILAIILGLVIRNHQIEKARQEEIAKRMKEIEEANRRREEADKAQKDANQSVNNIREMLSLTMAGDMNTPKGLERIETKLMEHKGQENENPDRKRALAGAFSRLATLWKDQGELDRSLTNFQTALDLVEAAKAAPGSDVSLATLLQLPRIYQERAELRAESSAKDSVDDGNNALTLLDRLTPEHKDAEDSRRLRAETLLTIAVAMTNLHNGGEPRHLSLQEAGTNLREAEKLFRQLLGQTDLSPEGLRKQPQANRDVTTRDMRNLARTLGYLGDVYLSLDKCHDADAVYWMSHQLRETLASIAGPREYEPRFQLARSWDNFARSQTQQRNMLTALHFYNESLKIRDELFKKQPDNKDNVVELTGVLNRIAELEVFAADPDSDINKNQAHAAITKDLDATLNRLSQCALLLNEVLDGLKKDDARHDYETAARIYSRLGECHALQVRAILVRQALLSADAPSEVIDEARKAATAAGDAFTKLEERRGKLDEQRAKTQKTSQLSVTGVPAISKRNQNKLSKEELYHNAAAKILSLELYQRKTGSLSASDLENIYKQWGDLLDLSIDRGFRRLAPSDIHRDRGFRAVLKKPWFQETEKKYFELLRPPVVKPAPQPSQTQGQTSAQ